MIFEKCYKGDDGLKESACLSLSAMMALVVLTVVGVIYALYLFIHAMGISDMAGVHISKNLMLGVKSVQGKLYSNKDKGIENWIVYKNENIGIVLKYPNDLSLNKTGKNHLELKGAAGGTSSKNKSLIYTLVIGKGENEINSVEQNFLKEKYPDWTGETQECFHGGKECLKTGVFKSVNGIYKEVVFWQNGDKLIYAESRYYSQDHAKYENIFEKIISEINIIHPVK